jgi:hypothetical protein
MASWQIVSFARAGAVFVVLVVVSVAARLLFAADTRKTDSSGVPA